MKTLMEKIETFYPKNIGTDDDKYYGSPEFKRLQLQRERARIENEDWLRLKSDIERSFPNLAVEDWAYLMHDASYICRIYIPNEGIDNTVIRAVIVCVSIVEPYYLIYSSEQEKIGEHFITPRISYQSSAYSVGLWKFIQEIIPRHFSGYEMISQDLATQKLKGISVGNKMLDEATVMDCLFTDNIW